MREIEPKIELELPIFSLKYISFYQLLQIVARDKVTHILHFSY